MVGRRQAHMIFQWEGHDLQEGPPVQRAPPKTALMSYATGFILVLTCTFQPQILLSGRRGGEYTKQPNLYFMTNMLLKKV